MARRKKRDRVEIKAAIKALNEQDELLLGADLITDKSTWIGRLFEKMVRAIHQLEGKNAKLKEVLNQACKVGDLLLGKKEELIEELMARLTRQDAEQAERQKQLERDGLTDSEIAKQMDCTVGNVEKRRRREGRTKLRPPNLDPDTSPVP
jgi:DNA-directed RNA polymerase specialized sigma24 family protein